MSALDYSQTIAHTSLLSPTMNNIISPKNVTRAEEDLQVARLQHANRNTLATAAKVSKAEKVLARLMKQVNPVALDAHRKAMAKMAGNA